MSIRGTQENSKPFTNQILSCECAWPRGRGAPSRAGGWRWHQVREFLSLGVFCSPLLCFLLLPVVLSQPCCPCHTLPVPCSPSPLSTGAVPRICCLCGVRRGQQVSLCLSQGSHQAEHPSADPGAAGSVPGAEESLLGWECSRDPWGEDGPHVYPQCLVPSTLHTQGQPSLCSQHRECHCWSGKEQGKGLVCSRAALGAHWGCCDPTCAQGEEGQQAIGEQGGLSNLPQCLFFPLSVKTLHLGEGRSCAEALSLLSHSTDVMIPLCPGRDEELVWFFFWKVTAWDILFSRF